MPKKQVQVFFHNNNKEKTIGILKRISAKINVNHNRNSILFFSKLDVPIRWVSKNFKVHFVFLIDAPNIFLGYLWPKGFENVLFSSYMVMVHFQPFFGFLIGRVTQQFYQDLKKKLDIQTSEIRDLCLMKWLSEATLKIFHVFGITKKWNTY